MSSGHWSQETRSQLGPGSGRALTRPRPQLTTAHWGQETSVWSVTTVTTDSDGATSYVLHYMCVCVVYTPHPLNSSNVICVASCQIILEYDFFIHILH